MNLKLLIMGYTWELMGRQSGLALGGCGSNSVPMPALSTRGPSVPALPCPVHSPRHSGLGWGCGSLSMDGSRMLLEEVPYDSWMRSFLFMVMALSLVEYFSVFHTLLLVEVFRAFGLGLCWGVRYWGRRAATCRWSLGSLF